MPGSYVAHIRDTGTTTRVPGMQPGPGEAIAAPTTAPPPVPEPPTGNGTSGPPPPAAPPTGWRARLGRPGVVAAIGVGVVVVGFGLWWLFLRDDGSSSSALTLARSVAGVTRGPMDTTVSADGTIAAAQTDSLSFSASGRVT